MSNFLIQHGSGGSFVGTTGRLNNPYTESQKRAAALTSDRKTVLVYGLVTTTVSPGLVDIDISGNVVYTPSTDGRVLLGYNGGDKIPETPVVVTNFTQDQYDDTFTTLILERRDDKYFAVAGLSVGRYLLRPRLVIVTTNSPAITVEPGELLRIDFASGTGDATITLSSAFQDETIGVEFGVFYDDNSTGNVRNVIIQIAGAPSRILDQYGRHVGTNQSLTLYRPGEYVRMKSYDATFQNWIVADDERLQHGDVVSVTEKTSNYTAVRGDFVPVNTSGGSRTISLPADVETGAEVAVKITTAGTTTVATVTATGSGASIVGGKLPVLSGVSVELFIAGDYVRLKHVGGNVWNVIAENVTAHYGEVHGSTTTGQTLNHNTATVLSLGTAGATNAGLNDTGSDRIVIRRAGRYTINYGVAVPTDAVMTRLLLGFRINGAVNKNISQQPNTTSAALYVFGTFTLSLAAGDALTLVATQLSSNSTARTTGIDATQVARLIVQEVL